MKMSVSLTPINNPDGESLVDMSNGTFAQIAEAAGVPWNGCHDPVTYTPEQLRALAKAIPQDWDSFYRERWSAGLEELAELGGATLS